MKRAFVCALLIACGGRPTPPPKSASHPLLDQAMPAFQRVAIDGNAIDTSAYAGKTVVVKFFADYCEPCKKTLPATERLHQSRTDVVVIGVSEDESSEAAARVVQRYRLTFPVIVDQSNVLSGRFRVSALPVTFVIDGRATIRWVGDEHQSPDDVARVVAAMQ